MQTIASETEVLLQHFESVKKYTEDICAPLKVEDYVPQSAYFASPPKWHLAHTTWFFEEMVLKQFNPQYQVYDPDFGFLFNSYYNHVGERTLRADRGNMTRPSVERVYEYRRFVNDHIRDFLQQEDSAARARELIALGLQHEQQHQELLITDLKYTLGHNPTFPVYHPNGTRSEGENTQSGWLKMEEGMHLIGHGKEGFAFDNEWGRHQIYLPSYEIAHDLVTNEEYLEFIQDGGYSKFQYWLDEGWAWVNEQQVQSPLYWHFINGKWFYYTLGGLKPVDLKAPVCHVSYYEAQAFATWKGLRLPTEFEWEAAADHLSWGQRWEWTNSAYLPYPGFRIAEGAVGEYNGKFMVNQMVLRGASSATSPGHSRKTYRNFFHPYFQWQYAGIRLAKPIIL